MNYPTFGTGANASLLVVAAPCCSGDRDIGMAHCHSVHNTDSMSVFAKSSPLNSNCSFPGLRQDVGGSIDDVALSRMALFLTLTTETAVHRLR